MKYFLLIFISITITIFSVSCKKVKYTNNPYESDAMIIGYDSSNCSCCGGYMISLVNNQAFYGRTLWTKSLPNSALSIYPSSSAYPYYVHIQFTLDTVSCTNTYIIINELDFK